MSSINRTLTAGLMVVTLLAGGCGPFSSSSDPDRELQSARKSADAGDVRMAAALYEKALRKAPDSARPHLELGLLYDEKLGDPIAAIYHYRQYLELDPNSERRTVVESYIERAKLTWAAKLPPANAVDQTELTRLQTEKAALMQENAGLRTRVLELERATPTGGDVVVQPPPPPVVTQRVVIGTVTVPPPVGNRTYVVQKKDTLYSIAEHFYGTKAGWEKIYAANRANLPSKDQLRVGQLLLIP
ncbi:MAG: LysM peptidoglycan-binding domain-containing protein [Verrucomicrobiota bacterium]